LDTAQILTSKVVKIDNNDAGLETILGSEFGCCHCNQNKNIWTNDVKWQEINLDHFLFFLQTNCLH